MNKGRIIRDADKKSVFESEELMEQAGIAPPQIVKVSRELGVTPLCYTVDEFVSRYHPIAEEGGKIELFTEFA